MLVLDVIHIPVIALIHLIFTFFWNWKVRNRLFKSKNVWFFAAIGSLFNVWGLDVVQRDFVIDSLFGMIQLSAGCSLVFVLATNAKYFFIYGWSKREFWLDYAGELIGFLLAGILIFVST